MLDVDYAFQATSRIDEAEERWERMRAESVCRDCSWCAVPDPKWYANPGKIAFCTHDEVCDFVRWNDCPADTGCSWFEIGVW